MTRCNGFNIPPTAFQNLVIVRYIDSDKWPSTAWKRNTHSWHAIGMQSAFNRPTTRRRRNAIAHTLLHAIVHDLHACSDRKLLEARIQTTPIDGVDTNLTLLLC